MPPPSNSNLYDFETKFTHSVLLLFAFTKIQNEISTGRGGMGGGKRNAKKRSSEKNTKHQQQQSSLSSTTTPTTSQQQQLTGRKARGKERGNESTGHPHDGSNSISTSTKTRTRGGECGSLMSSACIYIVAVGTLLLLNGILMSRTL